MAASESREGPGWWMDSEGGWNPPETWPESTPPLPGWIRGANGLWSASDAVTPAPVVDAATLNLVINNQPSENAKSQPRAAEITRTPKNLPSLAERRRASSARRNGVDSSSGARRHSTPVDSVPFERQGVSDYSPAHSASLLGFQGPSNEPESIDHPEKGEIQLGFASPVAAPLFDDEDLIPRWVRVTVNVVAATIAALIAGLLIFLLLL